MNHCGYIAIIGAPNAGKSTFLNYAVGQKISIVSPKVQTTRHKILGVLTKEGTQMLFLDTPGIFNAKKRFEQAMVGAAMAGVKEADIIMLMVDAQKGICEDTQLILDGLLGAKAKKILVINKVDAVDKSRLPPLASELFQSGLFDACFMISLDKKDGVDDVMSYLKDNLPEGPFLFPEDQLTDQPMRAIASEITRERLFYLLRQELPYSVAVETENWEEKNDGSVKIQQVIYVETESQKKIVLGAKGAMLKKVGEQSRLELGRMLERKVHLFLFVKVKEDWKDRKEFFEAMNLEFKN